MHRLRSVAVARKVNSLLFQKHLSDDVKSSITRRGLNHRTFCSKHSGDENGKDVDKASDKEKQNVNERSVQAKVKLDNLLKSIVEDSKKETGSKKSDDSLTIDMKLAVPQKEKPIFVRKSPEETELEENLGKEMVGAVKKVVECIDADPQVVESELVQKLKTQVGNKINMSDLFAGMKIDRGSKVGVPSTGGMELSRAHRVRRLLDERSKESKGRDTSEQPRVHRQRRVLTSKPTYVPIDLFGAPPFGIFLGESAKTERKENAMSKKLETWDMLHARDLKLSVTHPPANGFEEMILWTEQGKLWKFPINNEQGLDDEAQVPFHEHVFLEPQIEGWCPKKGPIRHFMELVCIGLSKNPFLSVTEKHEQIEWYHMYFKDKASIIKDVGAGEIK